MSKFDGAEAQRCDRLKEASVRLLHIQAPRSVVILFCVLVPVVIVVVWLVGFWLGNRMRSTVWQIGARSFAVQNGTMRVTGTATYRAKPGPWGDLECQRTLLEISDEYVSVRLHESDSPRWCFKSFSPDNLRRFFNEAGLSDSEKRDLLNEKK